MTGRPPASPWAAVVGGLAAEKLRPTGRPIQSEADAAEWLGRFVVALAGKEQPQIKLKCGASVLVAHFRLPGVLTLTPEGESTPAVTSMPGAPHKVATWRECL